MTILTTTQAANALRTTSDDPRMVDLLPQIDTFIERATGRDWSQDATKHNLAVSAATILLVMWFENPAMTGGMDVMPYGLTALLTSLEAEALKYRKYQFAGAAGAGGISLPEALKGDDVVKLQGVYGVSGSQTSAFEREISEEGYIQQISTDDLSSNLYVVVLKSPAADVGR